ncbi:hypothetical protein MKP05_16575 [Halomonas sp. EGI 63088]|uniref:Uncharacterized protein n=1 Tax=Halomonas flagellata TaxID=2920385 RepID=A0ABS9RXX9_9GAMM|nr:hypothetical protein [Halomonas flagellata]MCH4564718.1 hypothetical protein [Halomonas flagellata]
MLSILLVKWLSTAIVVIGVSVAVVRLGPKLGGVLAGTPIVLGPGYFFMLREQPSAFVADAALGSLHAMLATLAFCLSYVLLAGRWGALASVALAAALWVPVAAAVAVLPGGVALALAAIGLGMILALRLMNSLGLARSAVSAPLHWGDLLIRGALAGAIVCLATAILDDFAPAVSGVALSFPIGMLTIALTLHQRYGAEVARATLADTQLGMLSLIAFSAVLASSVESLASVFVFGLSLAASLLVSILLWFLHSIRPVSPSSAEASSA